MLNLSFRLMLFSVLFVGVIASAQSVQSDSSLEPKQDAYVYRVGRGEHIAEILRSMGYRNLWGAGGSVARTIQLNTARLAENNSLKPGQWIYLPKKGFRDSANFALKDGVVERSKSVKMPSVPDEVKPVGVSQVFKVTCPDGSLIDARVTIVPSSSPGGASRMVFDKNSPVCGSTVSQAPPAEKSPEANREPAQEVAIKEAAPAKDLKTESEPEDKPASFIDELRHTDKDRPIKSVLKPSWKPLIEPFVGYKDQKFTSSSGGFASYLGPVYGLNGGVEWGRPAWGIGGLVNYGTGNLTNKGVSSDKVTLTNKGVSSDKVTLTDLGVDLRLRHRSLFLQIGYAQMAMRYTFSGDTLSKSNTGLTYGLGYQGVLSEHWSVVGLLKHNQTSYGKDSKILNKLESSGWAASLGVQYRWGSDL